MKTGDIFTLTHTVTENETARFLGSGGLDVYATPAMICHMELAVYSLAEREGHQTVGTKVEVSHMRASLAGTVVTVTAELIEVDGRRLEFNVKVEDDKGVLGEGKHQRFVIDPERFMSRLR